MRDDNQLFKGKPKWLKTQLPGQKHYLDVKNLVKEKQLHTICTSGNCPNIGECWAAGTATLMILGGICTRSCKFCATPTGKPLPPDGDEPLRTAETVRELNLKHVVITSVDRDDLPDLGAGHWAQTILKVKELNPHTTQEVLIPDFDGKTQLLDQILQAAPKVIAHNLETVERLTPHIRSRAKYCTSLGVLKYLADNGAKTKSGIMLGLGETEEEVLQTMDDLLETGCRILTIGQYLRPSAKHHEVKEYIHPDRFAAYRKAGLEKGFIHVESAPLVRSSYHAEKHV